MKAPGREIDRTKHGQCIGCGECCADALPLTPFDVRRVAAYVRKHGIRPVSHKVNMKWIPPRDDMCPFFNDSKPMGTRCLVYPVRPIICRHYTCHGYADPRVHHATAQAMMDDAMREPDVRRNPLIFLAPRSMRYAIWPDKFPDYAETNLVMKE